MVKKENGRGGARTGCGRKPTGSKTRSYTVTLPLSDAVELEKRAEQCGMKIHRYLKQLILTSARYGNVALDVSHVDEVKNKKEDETVLYQLEKEGLVLVAADKMSYGDDMNKEERRKGE